MERCLPQNFASYMRAGARVGDFGGKNLGSVGSTQVYIDATEVDGVQQMQQWFNAGGATQATQNLSRTGGRADRRVTTEMLVDEVCFVLGHELATVYNGACDVLHWGWPHRMTVELVVNLDEPESGSALMIFRSYSTWDPDNQHG